MLTHERVSNASDASSPRKIVNSLTHLLTRVRVQVGQLMYVQARDTLVQWLHHIHRMMTVLMALSLDHQM
jgi:hypothetical protein